MIEQDGWVTVHATGWSHGCGRCHASGADEVCWWCPEFLCVPCWEEVGHCGHPEAEEQNRLARLRGNP